MKFSQCGALVAGAPGRRRIRRFVCDACQTIHYQNPKMVVGCIPEWEDRILLCRRAIEPRHGFWTLPAGFMELRETTAQAAAREALEEANASIEIGDLHTLYNLPHIDQVTSFRGHAQSRHAPGRELGAVVSRAESRGANCLSVLAYTGTLFFRPSPGPLLPHHGVRSWHSANTGVTRISLWEQNRRSAARVK
jgi:ADP-ribose pyrophosphatase YjhB (NUDIX family)